MQTKKTQKAIGNLEYENLRIESILKYQLLQNLIV